MIALLAALLVQDPYADLGRVIALPAPWEHIEVGDWTYIGVSADHNMVVFMQPARHRGKVWVRNEYLAPANGFRSQRYLAELDCESWKTRTLQNIRFSSNNLTGTALSASPSDWGDAAPGTFAENTLEFGCGD